MKQAPPAISRPPDRLGLGAFFIEETTGSSPLLFPRFRRILQQLFMVKLFQFLFGDPNKKAVDSLRGQASKVAAFETDVRALSDDALRAKTAAFRERLTKGETVDAIAPEAFAVAREASRRVLGQRPYDVQVMGGLVLHRGGIAEMRTGEGKTLTAVAPLYVNALVGKGAHLVTVNDYLARRDGVWMGRVFHALGLSTGIITHDGGFVYDPAFKVEPMPAAGEGEPPADTTSVFKVQTEFMRPVGRQSAYAADITYGTNNEFGFDYLRDNMAGSAEQRVMRGLAYAIVDEVDSILIDEARTPLIISAPADRSDDLYRRMAGVMPSLQENAHYNVDEKMRAATFNAAGISAVEKALGVENLYAAGSNVQFYAETALRAHALYKKDVQYVVRGGEVVIVDEFTGRLMPGRRFSEGLHQALEAKEGVEIQRESQTLATVTFQNFFRMYGKLSGMTGTAATEAEEFSKIYKLEVTTIPTNIDPQRLDLPDRVYKTEKGKIDAVVAEVKDRHTKGQPVLIGTVSIEKNEQLANALRLAGIPFGMLNAKNHESEGAVIAQAGRKGAVTLATNMAGRGVDIMLGGNPSTKEEQDEVRTLGGLHVLGTERHESRRIDNQLRGRSGRQGDPGSTQFFVSMDDDLMRVFGGDRAKAMLDKLGIPEDVPIESKMVSRSIEQAQHRVEGHNFDIRKHLLEYDDVLNKHREIVYARRAEVLMAKGETELKDMILELVEEEIEQGVSFHTGEAVPSVQAAPDRDGTEIIQVLGTIVPLNPERRATLETLAKAAVAATKNKPKLAEARTALIEKAMECVNAAYGELEQRYPNREELRQVERAVLLRATDVLWIDHLAAIGALRVGIGLQGYGQRDPLVEYKKESYSMFQRLLGGINQEVVYGFFVTAHHNANARAQQAAALKSPMEAAAQKDTTAPAPKAAGPVDFSNAHRNDPCPCGSGKKFKKCHGVNA